MYGDIGVSSTGEYSVYVQSIRSVINPDTGELAYRIIGKEFLNERARAKGSIQEADFYITEDLYRKSSIAVGDFVNPTLGSGGFATSLRIIYPGGSVPDTDRYEHDADDRWFIIGTIEKIDLNGEMVLINAGSEKVLIVPRAKGIIDTASKKVYPATLSDFHPGDRVCATASYGHGQYMFKNTAR